MKRQPIGVDDFKHIIDNNLFFVDKTLFIKQIIDDSSQVKSLKNIKENVD